MSNETVDVALCRNLWMFLNGQSRSAFADQVEALLAERTQLHAVIAELKKDGNRWRILLEHKWTDLEWRSFQSLSESAMETIMDHKRAAFDVADGEAK